MTVTTSPLQFLLLVFVGWVSRNQQEVIDYLREENRILREQLGGKRSVGSHYWRWEQS